MTAGVEFGRFLLGGGVLQAQHGDAVTDGAKSFERGRPDPGRGGIRKAKIGILALQPDELPHQDVIFGVGDLWVVQDVVAVIVVVEDAREFFYSPPGFFSSLLRHASGPILGQAAPVGEGKGHEMAHELAAKPPPKTGPLSKGL